MKRAEPCKILIARKTSRVDVAQFRMACSVQEAAIYDGPASYSSSDRNLG